MNQHVTVTCRVEVPLRRKRRGGVDGANLQRTATLPFLPRIGDMLSVDEGGDFLEVEQVFWSRDEGIEVWFKFLDDVDEAERMRKRGWKEFV